MVALPSIRSIKPLHKDGCKACCAKVQQAWPVWGHMALRKTNRPNKVKKVNRFAIIYPQFFSKVDNLVDNLLFHVEIYLSYTHEKVDKGIKSIGKKLVLFYT